MPSLQGKKTFASINPATGAEVGSVADLELPEVAAAVDAAAEAFLQWREVPAVQRGRLLRATGELLLERADDLASLITAEQGKPLGEAHYEVRLAAEAMFWFAEEARRTYGQTIPDPNGNRRLMTIKQPIGIVVAVTPWNIPLLALPRKVGAALAAGCAVVLKPAEQTPLIAKAFVAALTDAGIPAGVVNLVTVSDPGPAVAALIDDPRVRKLSFTGSTEVGKLLLERAAKTVTAVTLELGGNAPVIVWEDADLDAAVGEVVGVKTQMAGQNCLAPNRIYVQDSVYDDFLGKLVARVRTIVVGDGTEKGIQMGPLINEAAVEKVQAHVDDAVSRGGRLLTGGTTLPDLPTGLFFDPTVIADVPLDARAMTEETFGPLYTVERFTEEDEVVTAANNTEAGLAAYLFTRDLDRALRIGEKLEFGMVAINDSRIASTEVPFGGVKTSGLGRESGHEGIEAYLETKTFAIRA